MKNIFVKKYWDEEEILYYLHFQDGYAVRQIEVSNSKTNFFSTDDHAELLYDQNLDELDLDPGDFITKQEFEEKWGLS